MLDKVLKFAYGYVIINLYYNFCEATSKESIQWPKELIKMR